MKDNGSAPATGVFWTACLVYWRIVIVVGGGRGPRRITRFGCFGLFGRLPVPRQQGLKLMPFGSPRHDAFQHVGQPGQRFDIIQFADCTSVATMAQWRPPLSGPGP